MSIGEEIPRDAGDPRGQHLPVLLDAVVDALQPRDGCRIVDATFGAGGYARALLAAGASVLGIDRDPDVTEFARELEREFAGRFLFVPGSFSDLEKIAVARGFGPVQGVVLDIGVSSMQLDRAERGFSFLREGPLDMRMGQEGTSAADLINGLDERALSDILFAYGEEKRARRIAAAIVAARREKSVKTTLELARIIENAVGRRPGMHHPATRSFQALRIAVNREMDQLVEGLFAAERLLPAGGVLAVVTFHSLEDRIVKRFFDVRKSAGTVSRHMPRAEAEKHRWQEIAKPARARKSEIEANPRARSATLRWARRTAEEARSTHFSGLGVPGAKLFGTPQAGAA